MMKSLQSSNKLERLQDVVQAQVLGKSYWDDFLLVFHEVEVGHDQKTLTNILGEVVRYLGPINEVDNDGQGIVGALFHVDGVLLLSHSCVNGGLEVFGPSTDEVGVENIQG